MSESGELEADFELDDGDTGKSSFAVDELIEAELGRADAEEPRAELSLSAPALDDEVTDLPSEPDALFADDDEAERAVPERVVSRRARASAGAVAQPQNAAVMPQEAAAEPKKDFGGAPAPLEPSGALAEEQPERAPIAMTRKRRAGLWVALVIALLLTALVALVALRACSDGSADEVGGSTPAGETAPGGEK